MRILPNLNKSRSAAFIISVVFCSIVILTVDGQARETTERFTSNPFSNMRVVKQTEITYLKGEPEEIGRDYGLRHGGTMKLLIKNWLTGHLRLAAITGPFAVRRKSKIMASHLPVYYQEEVKAIAAAAGVSPLKVYQANFASDLLQMAMRPLGCSTFVVMPERSATGSMIYGRNLDYFRSDILRDKWEPVVFARTGQKKVLSLSVPGHNGVMTGINEDGVMMSILVSFTKETYEPRGVASLYMFRSVLEKASTAREARDLYIQGKRTVPVNVMIADGREAYVVEAGVQQYAVRTPNEHGTLYAANHFEDPSLQHPKHGRDKRWDVLSRYDRGQELLGISEVKQVIADAARDNPAFISQNILGLIVDFEKKQIIFGSDAPVAIEGRVQVINYEDVFSRLE